MWSAVRSAHVESFELCRFISPVLLQCEMVAIREDAVRHSMPGDNRLQFISYCKAGESGCDGNMLNCCGLYTDCPTKDEQNDGSVTYIYGHKPLPMTEGLVIGSAGPKTYHLAPHGFKRCDAGVTPAEADCKAAADLVLARIGQTPSRNIWLPGLGTGCLMVAACRAAAIGRLI